MSSVFHHPLCTSVLSVSLLCGALSATEYHVATAGNDTAAGNARAPFQSISKAAELAQPGDVITVHAGVYREQITPPRGGTSEGNRIVYRAAAGEDVTIKGSERVTGWERAEGDTWVLRLPNTYFGDFNPFGDLLSGDWYEAKQPYHTGDVYLNGHWLKEVASQRYLVPSEAEADSEVSTLELMNVRNIIPGGVGAKQLWAKDYVEASPAVEIIELKDGLSGVGRMQDGGCLTYDIDFGKDARNLAIYAASPLEGGLIEVRRESAEGELLGHFDAGFTAEWTSFQPYHANLKDALNGMHRIALVFKARPQAANNGQDDRGLWFAEVADNQTTIWAQFKDVNPNEELVEINVRQSVFYPETTGINYITVEGFTMEQAAAPWAPPTAEQIGLIGTNWSKGWLIQSNTIRYSSCVGITLGKHGDEFDNTHDYFRSIRQASEKHNWNREHVGSHLVRNNQIYHCGQAGIVGSLGAIFSTITGNEIHDIRQEHAYGGCETAGIKIHGAIDMVISHNHVYDCEHWGGIWLDWMAQGARVTGNLLHGNSQDMMFEVNHGPFLVDNNLLLSQRYFTKVSDGGAYVHNLIWGKINLWPTEQRKSPYMKAHSAEVAEYHAGISQEDDRYYNTIFVGPGGTATLDAHDFNMQAAGNLFLAGARPSKHDQHAVVVDDYQPQIKLTETDGAWWLEMQLDPSLQAAAQRPLVDSELLGLPVVTQLPYEDRDGQPYRIDTDYFGLPYDAAAINAGPFASSKAETIRVKVWPKSL
jgi:alpha-N-arabinofuranosidase